MQKVQSLDIGPLLHWYDEKDELHKFLFHALSRQKKEQSFLRLHELNNAREKSVKIFHKMIFILNNRHHPNIIIFQVRLGVLVGEMRVAQKCDIFICASLPSAGGFYLSRRLYSH